MANPADKMVKHAAEIDITVPFFDVDSMEICWHGHYVKYLELARCALLEQLGYSYTDMRDSGYAWPIIDLKLRYPRSAHFEQKIVVRAELLEWQHRLRIQYRVRDKATGELLTKGETSQVAVNMRTQETCLRSPDVLFHILGVDP